MVYITSFHIFSSVKKNKLATIYTIVTNYFIHILTLQKMCQKSMFSGAWAGTGSWAGATVHSQSSVHNVSHRV